MRSLLRPALFALVLIAALAAGAAWLLASPGGLRALAGLAGPLSGGRLSLSVADGSLIGPFTLRELRWRDSSVELVAEQVAVDWQPGELPARLHLQRLAIARLAVTGVAGAPPSPPPADLLLPLAVAIDEARVEHLAIAGLAVADALRASFASDGRQHRIAQLQASRGGLQLHATARLDGAAPPQLAASAEVRGALAARPLALELAARGPLARLPLTLRATAGVSGDGSAWLTPFAAAPLAEARLQLREIDPAAWQDGLPQARLGLDLELRPQGDGFAADFALRNRQPGRLDDNRLPLAALRGKADWQPAATQFSDLQASLPGGGELAGQGRWQDGQLALDLQARRLDLARLSRPLRPTGLAGRLVGRLGGSAQTLQVDLHDDALRLLADARHAAGRIALERLELTAGTASLLASGELELHGEQRFRASGELRRFDPSRFAQLPAATLNAQLAANGRLGARAQAEASFALHDSRYAGQPLSGDGLLTIAWPRLPRVALQLALGANRLSAQGAFGDPADRLQLDLEAPQLAAFGIDGGLRGHFALSGGSAAPRLEGELRSERLARPGHFRLLGLQLKARAGGAPDAPLAVDLDLGRLDLGEQPGLVRDLRLRVDGENRRHRLNADARIADSRLQLAAAGGLQLGEAWRWQGQLDELRFDDAQPARQFRLAAPGRLAVGADGWQLGPLQLRGEPLDWRATLRASADRQQLHASLQGAGSRVGEVAAQLDAALQGPWALARDTAWQGSARAAIPDLGWLAELLGDDWQSAGRAEGELRLAGTPARPLLGGRLNGSGLALRRPEQGLALENGELAVDLADNLLRVRRLVFESRLRQAPRPLRLAGGPPLAALTARPGRLEAAGELRLDDRAGAAQAVLDVTLDRVGAWQQPDQWLTLSGSGRLRWQAGGLAVQGRLAVDAGYWQLAESGAPRLSDDVVILRPGQTPAPSLRPPLDLDLSTELGEHFLFVGAGLNAHLTGEVHLRASGRDLPRASGAIRTRDGRFEAYGQKLELSRGVLTFQGLLDNPGLDVRAVRRGLSVEPGVQIGGSAQRPLVKLISDPEMPDAEKLSWLVLGHGPEHVGPSDASVLLAAAGGLLGNNSGGLVAQLRQRFGLDELGVRQGQLGDNGGRRQVSRVAGGSSELASSTGNQIFSIGKRLSANALLSYEQVLGKAESVVKLTVNLGRQLSLVGRAGSDNALDLFYTLSFGQKPPATAPAAGR